MAKLTALKIRNLDKPGRYGDGDGLHLRVSKGGAKAFILRKIVDGRRVDIPLGRWPDLSLANARQRASELRLMIQRGEYKPETPEKAMPTFKEAAQKTFEAISPRWKNPKVAYNWMHRLEKHAMTHLGEMPVDEIGREDILRVLTPIWTSKPETARKVRRYIKQVFSWAMANGYADKSPAGELIDGALPSMPAVKANYRALPFAEVGEALEIIRASRASMSARACLEFTILTACRSGEARLATWAEVEGKTWRIPASRTKNGREHRQPLSDQAVAVLEKSRALHAGDLIFPSPVKPGEPLSAMTLTKVLRDTGLAERAVVHGFRSSFRSWASEATNADFATAELCLGHSVGSAVERAYRRSDLLEKRARLLQSWADYACGAERGKVISLHA